MYTLLMIIVYVLHLTYNYCLCATPYLQLLFMRYTLLTIIVYELHLTYNYYVYITPYLQVLFICYTLLTICLYATLYLQLLFICFALPTFIHHWYQSKYIYEVGILTVKYLIVKC